MLKVRMTDILFSVLVATGIVVGFFSERPLALGGTVAAATSTPSPYPLFSPFIPQIKAHLAAPLRLPSTVLYALSGTLYATLDDSTSTTYEIVLTSVPSCNFLPACEVGRILSEPSSVAYDTSSGNLRLSQSETLADGTPAIVGIQAYKAQSVITWVENSRTYAIELYVNTYPADLLTMANSMTTY